MWTGLRKLRRRWRRWQPLGGHPAARWTWAHARRVIVAVIGGTLLLLGVVMFVTPGPALIVVPLGLGVLGMEFIWAVRLQRRVLRHADGAVGRDSALRRWWRRRRGQPA